MKTLILKLAIVVAVASATTPEADAEMRYLRPLRRAAAYNWHGNYAYTPYGAPTSVVVPPTAQMQTNWSWGAPSSRVTRIDHQFTRYYGGASGAAVYHTPHWPQDTGQFGLYYVRGPWYPTQQ